MQYRRSHVSYLSGCRTAGPKDILLAIHHIMLITSLEFEHARPIPTSSLAKEFYTNIRILSRSRVHGSGKDANAPRFILLAHSVYFCALSIISEYPLNSQLPTPMLLTAQPSSPTSSLSPSPQTHGAESLPGCTKPPKQPHQDQQPHTQPRTPTSPPSY